MAGGRPYLHIQGWIMQAIRCTFVSLLLVFATAAHASAGVFTHPAKTYSLDTPFAWKAITDIDTAGRMHHVFTPQWTGGADKVDRGIWVFSLPIPNDSTLTAESACAAAAAFLKTANPSLTIDPKTRTDAKLGDKLAAWSMPAEGKLAGGGGWKGVVRVAYTLDSLIIVAAGGPPKESDGVVKDAEKSLAKFICPLPLKPWNEAPVPKGTQRPRDVTDQLQSCTMMLRVLAPNPNDPSKFMTIGSGTGFFIHPDGYILTNRHVVERGDSRSPRRPYDPLLVTFDQMERRGELMADVVAISHQWDIALLKIRGNEKWPFLRMSDFAEVKKGDHMALIGWPLPDKIDLFNITVNNGIVARIDCDSSLRPRVLVCATQSAQGNSGGPIHDLDLGGIIGVLYRGFEVESHGVKDMIYIGAVPIEKVLWEFPQLLEADAEKPREMSDKERHALIKYYLGQQRYGAAMLECRRIIEKNPKDGAANAYLFHIYSLHGDSARAMAALAHARADKNSEYLAALFAGKAAVDQGDAATARVLGEAATRLQPKNVDGHLLMAHALALTLDRNAEAKFAEVVKLAGGSHGEAQAMLGVLPVRRWLADNTVVIRDPNFKMPANLVQAARQHLLESVRVQPYDNGLAHSHLCQIAGLCGEDAPIAPAARAAFASAALDPHTRFTIAHHDLMFAGLSAIGVANTINAAHQTYGVREGRFGAFVTGFANLRFWLYLRGVADPKAQAEAKQYLDQAVALLNISIQGGEPLWWKPMALRLLDATRQNTAPTPATTPNPRPFPQPVAKDPAAGINLVQEQHGVFVDGKQGLVFSINIDLAFAKGQECAVVVVIRDTLDNALKGVSKDYTLADGVMGAAAVVKAGSDFVRGHTVKIFMPYDDIHQAAKGADLQYSAAVYNLTIKKWINGNRHQQRLFIPPPGVVLDETARDGARTGDKGVVAKIAAVTPKYDVEKDGKKGLLFTVDCSVFSVKGKEVTVGFHFVDLRGRGDIAARSKEYSDAKGLLFASVKLKPDDERFFAKGVEVFVPYDELGVGDQPAYMMYQASIRVGNQVLTEDQFDQAIQGMLQFNMGDARREPRRRNPYDAADVEVVPDPRGSYVPRPNERPDRRAASRGEQPAVEPPARRKLVSARINDVKAVSDITKDGKKGVMIYVEMGVFDAAGSKVDVGVSFSDSRNRPIAAKNAGWSDSRGLLQASTKIDVPDDKFFPKAVEVFIPYTELVPAAGKHTIRYTVNATREGRQLAMGPRNTIEFVVEEKDFK